MVEELKLAIKIDDASIEQSLLKQFANAQKMADKVVLDFRNVNFDDKQIEAKFKEMQKRAGQNPIDLTIGGNTLDMLGQIDKRLTEIFSIGKGKSFIDSSSIVADISKIENKINELNKKYEEAQKKLSSIGSGNISGKDVNLVDNAEFQKLSQEVSELKNQFDDLKTHIQLLDDYTVPTDRFFELQSQVETTTVKVSDLVEEFTKLSNAQKTLSSTPQESNISSGRKDAFPNADYTASVEKVADGFKEVKQNTEQATEVAEKYQRVLSQVGELGVDAKVSAMYQRNDGQLESVSWKAKRDDQGQILYDKDGNIDYDFNMTVISKYEQLEKIITTADNKLRDLKKSLQDTQNLNPNATTDNIEKQIQYQENYIKLLEQTVKAISQQDEYLLYEQQIIDARAKAKKEYNLNQGTKSDISNAKQLASEESKRQKAIEQTNRLLNRQQITIDNIEKSYNKTVNPDLDKSVSDASDLSELAKKKSEIQYLINQLNGQERNSSNEKEFLQLEKLISEYKQLAKDKLKANNPSKQELGGQDLKVLLEQQVSQYNQLISKAEKYGDATSDIVEKLKVQRDLIAQANSDGVYTAKSGLKADDYYSARDNYKISKAQFSSYETDIKNTERLIQAQKELGEATTAKSRQSAKDAAQSSVDNALQDQVTAWKNIQSIREKIAKTKDSDEIANLQQAKKEYQQSYIEADKILKANSSLYDKETQIAKLEQIRLDTNKKIADYQNKQISGYDTRLEAYTKKTSGYNATIARFNEGGWTSDTYLKNVQAVKNAVNEYETLLNELKGKDASLVTSDDISKLDEYEKKIKDTIATVTNMSASEKGYNFVSGQKELDKIHKLLNENSKMSSEAKAKIRAYYAEIESGNPSMSLDKIHGEILKIYNAEVEAGRAGRTLWDTLKNSGFHQIAAQMAGMFGVYDVINVGKNAFNTVKELDYALVDLKKTTAMNSSELEQFYYDSNDVAKQMGVTTKEIIDQASSWSRLGYNSKQAATEMAKLSSQFALISPGMDTTTSQEGLVSIMKAWDIGYQDVKSQIMDDINALGNAMAEDNQDIVEGMERSAAALAAVGTSTKDAFALFSGIQEVLQNSEKSGTSLRSVALRLRSFDESTEEYSSDLANITGELADLTKTAEHAQGVSVFKAGSTTEFKSLVDYFREIADIWDEMSQKQQNDFLLKAFGRTQAQAGAALIQNFKGVEKALNVMDNAAGSSDKEMETAKQSITYKLNELKQTWVGTVQDIADRGDINIVIDGLTKLSEALGWVIDKMHLIPTLAIGGGLTAFIKNFDWLIRAYTKTLSNSF